MVRVPEGRELGCGQLWVWRALRALLAGSGGGDPAEIEFGAFLALKYDVRWQQFQHSVVLPRPQTSKSKIFGEAMPPLASD